MSSTVSITIGEILAGIKAKLETLDGIENVKDYLYWSDDFHDLIDLEKDAEGYYHEWQVGLAGNPLNNLGVGEISETFSVSIVFKYSLGKPDGQTYYNFIEKIDTVKRSLSIRQIEDFFISPLQVLSVGTGVARNAIPVLVCNMTLDVLVSREVNTCG